MKPQHSNDPAASEHASEQMLNASASKVLMLHVEQIVRPVRAFAARKLRMRREMLAHLRAAMEEERANDGDAVDPDRAIERAKIRLGDPQSLTDGLQETVPWIERTLLARLPIPAAAERWEKRSARWWRPDSAMNMLHLSLLVASATLFLAFAMLGLTTVLHLDRAAAPTMMFEHPLLWGLINVASSILIIVSIIACLKFIAALASGRLLLRSKGTIAYASAIVSGPVLSMLLVVGSVNQRAATGEELLACVGIGLLLLASQVVTGRVVEKMRRPYADWLQLEVAL
jgi:hypothetical protein